ncbi:hypothetical protein AB8Q18_08570 [Neisseriaceae bacterium CLB008]
MNIKTITDQDLDDLIKCHKRATKNARDIPDKRHIKKDFSLVASKYPEYKFTLYIRHSLEMEDDYTVGLRVSLPKEKNPLTLVRFNGSSHGHKNVLEDESFPFNEHIHKATERYIKAKLKAEGYALVTDQYTTVEGALLHACEICNITGILANTISAANQDLFN